MCGSQGLPGPCHAGASVRHRDPGQRTHWSERGRRKSGGFVHPVCQPREGADHSAVLRRGKGPGGLHERCSWTAGAGPQRAGAVCKHERRADEPPGVLEDHQVLPGESADQQRYHAPHPAPLLCGSPAGKRSGPPIHSGDAGARGHFFYADLFSYGQTEAAGCVS